MNWRRIAAIAAPLCVCQTLAISPRLAPSVDPDAPAGYLRLLREARSLSSGKQFQEAEKLLETAVAINPVNGEAWVLLGRNRYDLKQWERSIAAYRQAIDLGQGYAWSSAYDICCCYALWGKKGEALKWLDKAMRLGWRDLSHLSSDTDLASLRKEPSFIAWAAAKDVSKMSRDEAFRYDLWLLDRELRRKHYSPYRLHSSAEFEAYVKRLHADIPKLNRDQILASFMKLAAMCGDGHTNARPPHDQLSMTPLQFYWFEDGMVVTAAGKGLAEFAGAKLVTVAGKDWKTVVERSEPYISRDNAMGVRSMLPRLLSYPGFLHGIGVTPSADQVEYGLELKDGSRKTAVVKAEPMASMKEWTMARSESSNPEPLTMKNRSKPFWFEYLPERKLVFFQYNAVRNSSGETTQQFGRRLEAFVAEHEVETLVIDIRWNGGGNTFLNIPLEASILRMAKINKPGHLFVITGRETFSACQNFATDLDMRTDAIFVGEPTGSKPNFIGETVMLTLPYSRMAVSISDLYWGRGWPMDYRIWIAPELYAPPTFALFKDNRDPAMEAVLAYLDAQRESGTLPSRPLEPATAR